MAMVAVNSVSASTPEMDAARALLDLQCDIRVCPDTVSLPAGHSFGLNAENTTNAAFCLTRLFASGVTPSPYSMPSLDFRPNMSIESQENSISSYMSQRSQDINSMEELIKKAMARRTGNLKSSDQTFLKRLSVMNRRPRPHRNTNASPFESTDKKIIKDINNSKTTRDVGTQTDFLDIKIENTNATIADLCEKIKALQAQVKMYEAKCKRLSLEGFSTDESDEDYQVSKSKRKKRKSKMNQKEDTDISFADVTEQDMDMIHELSENDIIADDENNSTMTKNVLRIHNVNTVNTDLVPIGEGNAKVPSRLLKHMNWTSYTSVTRKLLTAIFSRRILATHSLTGKPSPAFPDKPAKKKLDPALVNDIVQTVVERCRVPENVVRTSITTKCADESKMFRTRVMNIKKRQQNKNCENIPPEISDSDE